MKIKTLAIVGTRPEAIKMAPIITRMQLDSRFDCHVCATGQHQEMLYQILDWFDIRPDFRLDVMAHNQPLAHLAGRLLNGLHTIIENEQPDMVLVQGDTTSAFIGALAAYYNYDFRRKKPLEIAHIEAGLRTHDNYAPYPEEGSRRLIGPIAHWHFAPTLTAAEALFAENITSGVYITGNTVIDALLETVERLRRDKRDPLPQIAQDKRIILVTGHRRENYGEGFHNICLALEEIARRYPNDQIVYPVHLNPNVRGPVMDTLGHIANVHLVRPMDYPDFVAAMMRSHIILTDSGGVQEEAPSLGKPVLVMRNITERPDAVAAGTVKLVGTQVEKIVYEASRLLDDARAYEKMARAINPYGDGRATERILNLLAGEAKEKNAFGIAA